MQSLEDLRQRSRMVVLRLVAEAAGAPSDGQHQQHAHQDAGDPASHEQTANGDLADGAVHMAGAGVTAKPEQRSFCSAQNHTSFGVKLAYGVVFAGNPSKEKARNFSVHQEFQAFLIANWKFTAQSASSWGCGKNWLCYRPSDSNNVHEVNPLFNEPSNKLQQRPQKLCTVLVTALF